MQRWDDILVSFLNKVGLVEARKGLELDLLVLNPEHEQKVVPTAISDMLNALQDIEETSWERTSAEADQHKTAYVSEAVFPMPPTYLNRSISQFLAANRARSNASNTTEFIQPRPQKRRRLSPSDPASIDEEDQDEEEDQMHSARTLARRVDRETQMRYDVAKNVDGPLGRTMQNASSTSLSLSEAVGQGRGGIKVSQRVLRDGTVVSDSAGVVPNVKRYPGLDERLKNVEEHLGIRYIPSHPEDIRLRLSCLEEHLIRLEREYPPWAALHFNPPRSSQSSPESTQIIIPTHLTAINEDEQQPQPPSSTSTSTSSGPDWSTYPTKPTRPKRQPRGVSSLQRAVLEKLEIKKAMEAFDNQ